MFVDKLSFIPRLDCSGWTQDTGHTALGTLVWSVVPDGQYSPPTLPSHLRISPNNRVYLRYYEPNVCVDIYHNLETMKLITLLITDQTNMLIVLWLAFYHHQSETQTRCRQQTGTGGGGNSLDNVIWPENNISIYASLCVTILFCRQCKLTCVVITD